MFGRGFFALVFRFPVWLKMHLRYFSDLRRRTFSAGMSFSAVRGGVLKFLRPLRSTRSDASGVAVVLAAGCAAVAPLIQIKVALPR